MHWTVFALVLFCFGYAESKNYSWDFLMFAQVWPFAECHVANEVQNGSCRVPDSVNTWTIHGLWPDTNKGEGPSFCPGQQRHFNISALAAIEDRLKLRWPNLLPAQSVSSLWKHEWTKHGSCALTLASLESELLYFSAGLNFNEKYDILKTLQTVNIVPSDNNPYSLDNIKNGLGRTITQSFFIHCVHSKVSDQWFLSDVRICLDKQFNLISCPKNYEDNPYLSDFYKDSAIPTPTPCPNDKPLYYLQLTGRSRNEDNYNSE